MFLNLKYWTKNKLMLKTKKHELHMRRLLNNENNSIITLRYDDK